MKISLATTSFTTSTLFHPKSQRQWTYNPPWLIQEEDTYFKTLIFG